MQDCLRGDLMSMRILFQGDSITDAVRHREIEAYSGSGYVTMISGRLGVDYPGKYEVINRGIGGNRTTDLLARLKEDVINLRPDILSILIGVNDVWSDIVSQKGVSAALYEKVYKLIIDETLEVLPDVRIIILEPYVLKGSATELHWDSFEPMLKEHAKVAKRVADRYQLEFIPLQRYFDDALHYAPAEHWLRDGVHPTAAGHELIARAWMDKFLACE